MDNCITYWLPRLIGAGLPVPRTEYVRVPASADWSFAMEPGHAAPEWWGGFCRQLVDACKAIGGPGGRAFLRSGTFSGKHEWSRTCDVREFTPDALGKHVKAIVYFGELVNFIGFPWHLWAVREFLEPADGDVAFEASEFMGMPVRREYRAFVRDGQVLCVHPYWPADAFYEGLSNEQQAGLDRINADLDNEAVMAEVRSLASRAGIALGGEWSVDLLSTNRGWFVTDCAIAKESWHWPACTTPATPVTETEA